MDGSVRGVCGKWGLRTGSGLGTQGWLGAGEEVFLSTSVNVCSVGLDGPRLGGGPYRSSLSSLFLDGSYCIPDHGWMSITLGFPGELFPGSSWLNAFGGW
jgi:hypothetical protein